MADSGGIIAALDLGNPARARFAAVLESATRVYLTTAVVAEVHQILVSRNQAAAAVAFLRDVSAGAFDLVPIERADLGVAADLIVKYGGQMRRKRPKPGSIDLADALNVVAAARVDTNLILALDQDYRVIRPLTAHPAFALIPQDLEP
ncbi:MAG: PIN domain-containing protein [Propionibacteriaceae bacterium]|nr:PIN domain-containing protein [Propionibacteriaceae bacterium]